MKLENKCSERKHDINCIRWDYYISCRPALNRSPVDMSTEADADIDSEYNAFGYDPFGIVAHLCHYFFGPEWRPTTNGHLDGLPITKGRPRYGQPSPHQARLLPVSFTFRPPPLYFGTPTAGSYIDGPLNFEPCIFAALLLRPLRHIGIDPTTADCYQDIHGMEVMNEGALKVSSSIDAMQLILFISLPSAYRISCW